MTAQAKAIDKTRKLDFIARGKQFTLEIINFNAISKKTIKEVFCTTIEKSTKYHKIKHYKKFLFWWIQNNGTEKNPQ